ncbi:MAG: DASH family cryptochrome [Balneolaceae bacterium]|nr:DASH family cryptochrome [Balneolaceae bacterium]
MKSIIWLRNDLRTIDHAPLSYAAENGELLIVYCIDPDHFRQTEYGFIKTGSHRARFLTESLINLREKVRKLGGELVVRRGRPKDLLPELITEASADQLLFHGEVTAEEIRAENEVEASISIPLRRFWGHSMYHRDDLPFGLFTVPDVFTQFRKGVEKKGRVRDPLPAPESIIPLSVSDPGSIPTPEELIGEPVPKSDLGVLTFRGGESEAWSRLNHYFFEGDHLRNYKYTRNGLLGADYSSKFSPWLAHGCISARSIHAEVERYEKEVHENVSTYWMKFELIWRDYFRYSAIKYGDRIFKLGGIQNKNLKKQTDPEQFRLWAEGRTGIPFVDANMRELNETGFMSNRGRQNVASFLAQNMNFDWRWGAAWFEKQLIDYDVCSNWGNWAYNATVGHDPRNRYFNILNQANKYDKKGEFVRHWLPELKDVPKEYIHEPHRMAEEQQGLFGPEIGKDYPMPILDLEKSYERIRSEGD